MNWTHSSKGVALAVLLATAVVVVGTAGAVTVTGSAPDATEVGEDVSMQVTVEDPFENQANVWTLQGSTELVGASWSVEAVDVGGDVVERQDTSGGSFTMELDSNDGISEVTIELQGDVPEMDTFNYRDREIEEYVAMDLLVAESGGSLAGMPLSAHRYTEESLEARQAIDEARDAIGDSGSDSEESQLDTAITLYNSGEFEAAIEEANSIRESAEDAEQTRTVLFVGGGVVLVVLVLGGGFYLYRQRQRDTSKLQ
ncbi:MAG: hypothetical protein V5A55_11040 [Halovenus sp.]